MSQYGVICIHSCPIQDSLYSIKDAFEIDKTCRVRKIFAAKWPEESNCESTTKIVYIWVEWTTSSWIFTSILNHFGKKAVFKLDKLKQPIFKVTSECTSECDYPYEHWFALSSSNEKFAEDELYFGSRVNDNKWDKYLAPGVSLYDAEEIKEKEQTGILSLQPVLEIPELKHNSITQITHEPIINNNVLSLLILEEDEEIIEKVNQEEMDDFIKNNFILKYDFKYNDINSLSKKELRKLARGDNVNLIENSFNYENKITFPNGHELNLKK